MGVNRRRRRYRYWAGDGGLVCPAWGNGIRAALSCRVWDRLELQNIQTVNLSYTVFVTTSFDKDKKVLVKCVMNIKLERL